MAEISIPYFLDTPNGTLTFNPASGDGYYLKEVQALDSPTIRATIQPLPQRDGSRMFDSFYGGRGPILEGYIRSTGALSNRLALEDQLRSYLSSILRADGLLRWQPSGTSTTRQYRQLTVRLNEAPIIQTGDTKIMKDFHISLWAPSPTIYSQLQNTGTTAALSLSGGGSLTYPFSFPFTFGSYTTGGTVTVSNQGNANSYPILKLWGNMTGPIIANTTSGYGLSLSTLSIADGDYVQIDCEKETVLLNGDATTSLSGKLDIPASVFFSLGPGNNTIRLAAQTFNANAKADVLWRDGFA